MSIFKLIRENKGTVLLALLALAWLLVRHPISAFLCSDPSACLLYPDSWPGLSGIDSGSSPLLVGFLAAVLFALPLGRSGLLATLVGIRLAEPLFGAIGVFMIFLGSSAFSIILVHHAVEYGMSHPKATLLRVRLKPAERLLGPVIRKNGVFWLAAGNLVGSQWQMSALGILSEVSRVRIWTGLMLGNLAGFFLLYFFGQTLSLDAISIVLLVLLLPIVLLSPVFILPLLSKSPKVLKKGKTSPGWRRKY